MIVRVFHRFLWVTLITGALAGVAPIASLQAIAAVPDAMAHFQSKQQGGPRLPGSVSGRVRRELARFLNISRRQVSVESYSSQIWTDSCLELGTARERCRPERVQGWRVVVSNGNRNWTYRSDRNGRRLRLEVQGNNLATTNLPDAVFDAVVQDARERSRRPLANIRLIWADERNWPDSCLGLSNPAVICTAVVTPGWLIGVEVERQTWVYRTDNVGVVVRPEAQADVGLPGIVSQRVLQDVRTRTTESVRIIQYDPQEWTDGCLGLAQAGEFCTQAIVSGWRVIVENSTGQRWAYRTNNNASALRLEQPRPQTPIPRLPR